MKLVTVKKVSETGIAGIEFVYTDKAISEIVIGKLRIRKGESYSPALQVLIETPFEDAERWELTGRIQGFPDAVSFHDTKHVAELAAAKLEEAGATTAIRAVAVQIDDDGNVVSVAGGREAGPDADDLSF